MKRKRISLRDENTQRARERILDALAGHLARHGAQDLSLPAVARSAGVGVATIYRYYPTREALLDGYAAWVQGKLGFSNYDFTLEEWPQAVAQAFEGFDGIADAVRGQLALQGTTFRHVRNQRLQAMARTLEPALARLPPGERTQVLGVLGVLTGGPAWKLMRDDWDLDGAAAGSAVRWALRVLVEWLSEHPSSLDFDTPDPNGSSPRRRTK